MRLTNTVILAVVAIMLGFAIHRVDQEPAYAGGSAPGSLLMRFEEENVDRIVVERGPSKTVMQKKQGFWFFEEPEQDLVDPAGIDALLDQLNHLKIVDKIEAEKGQGELSPQQIGVRGDDAIKIVLSGSAEEGKEAFKEGVVLGISAPRSDSLYVRKVGDEDESYVVEGNPRKWVETPLESLRDRRILGARAESIVQLAIRRSTGEMVLQRRVTPPLQDWAIVSPIQVWAGKEILDQLLADISGMRIQDVIREGDLGEAIPNPLPDGSAVLLLWVYGIENPITLYLKTIEEEEKIEGMIPLLEARISGRPAVYRFRSGILDKLPATVDDLRDRTLARIPSQYLESIVIQSRIDPPVVLQSTRMQEGIRWDVRINSELLPANYSEISNLVNGVNEAVILDFASDTGENLAEFGLDPPARKVAFNLRYPGQPDEDGNPGADRQVARVLNLGWRSGDEQRLFANFEGEPYVYELNPSFVGMIPTHPIKWRSLRVLTFNPFHLESINREVTGRDVLKLDYHYQTDTWKAHRNGVEVSRSLDDASARRLRDRLGSLTASGWYLSLPQAYEALEKPSARFTVVTRELDRATGDEKVATKKVVFAKSPTDIYFGQIEGSPDVFYMEYETYRDLIRPLTR